MQKYQYIKIDSILSKFNRDFRGLDIDEGDAIEWIGEALGFIKLASASEEAIAFIEVKNYHAQIPAGLHYIIQLARNNDWVKTEDCAACTIETIDLLDCVDCDNLKEEIIYEDCQGNLKGNYERAYYRPFFDLQYEYLEWANKRERFQQYTPIRLANHSFFNTLVCKEENMDSLYTGCVDEYTIVNDQLRFSFEEGFVALAYLRQKMDNETGYPMIPDDEAARTAITYYLGWKFKEREAWNHREGALGLSKLAEEKWLKYRTQFASKTKMPTGVDQYQNLMEQSKYLLPRQDRYYGFFGKLGRPEDKRYNNPRRIIR